MTEAKSMPPEMIRSAILKGQKALIIGIANDHSIAWGCAQAMHRAGAEIAMTYLNDKARPYVEPLASAVETPLLLPLEVRDTVQVDALFEAIAARWGRLDCDLEDHGVGMSFQQDTIVEEEARRRDTTGDYPFGKAEEILVVTRVRTKVPQKVVTIAG